MSLLKICATETRQRAGALLAVAGDELGLNVESAQVAERSMNLIMPLLISLPSSIAAGSNEIQRNIVARHVLDLPQA